MSVTNQLLVEGVSLERGRPYTTEAEGEPDESGLFMWNGSHHLSVGHYVVDDQVAVVITLSNCNPSERMECGPKCRYAQVVWSADELWHVLTFGENRGEDFLGIRHIDYATTEQAEASIRQMAERFANPNCY